MLLPAERVDQQAEHWQRKQHEHGSMEGSGTRVDWRRSALRRSCLFNCAGSETTSATASATTTASTSATSATAAAKTEAGATATTTTGAEG